MAVRLMSELRSAVDALTVDDVHAIPEPHLLALAEEILTVRNMLDAQLTRTMQALDVRQVTVNECGRAAKSWLVEEQYVSPDRAGRLLWVARALPSYPALGAAFAAGEISLDHVRVILGALRALPVELRDVAETELTEAARHADPTSLGRACRELRTRLGADESAEAAAQRRYDSRWATMSTTFDGMLHLEAMLDPEAAATLTAALAPLLVRAGEIDDRTVGQRRADALTELARLSLTFGQLPDHNGERPQVMTIIGWDELRDGLVAGQLSQATVGGYEITPNTARQLACDADILPAVLNGKSELLDLGRATRTWTKAQRRAARLRDQGCVFPHCQANLEHCQLHHLLFWANGGRSDHANSAHLCHFHHHLVHHGRWTITRNPAGRIDVRRT